MAYKYKNVLEIDSTQIVKNYISTYIKGHNSNKTTSNTKKLYK